MRSVVLRQNLALDCFIFGRFKVKRRVVVAAVLASVAIVIVVTGILIGVNASSISTHSTRSQMPATSVQAPGGKPSAEIPVEMFGRSGALYSLKNSEDSCNPDNLEASKNPGVCE